MRNHNLRIAALLAGIAAALCLISGAMKAEALSPWWWVLYAPLSAAFGWACVRFAQASRGRP